MLQYFGIECRVDWLVQSEKELPPTEKDRQTPSNRRSYLMKMIWIALAFFSCFLGLRQIPTVLAQESAYDIIKKADDRNSVNFEFQEYDMVLVAPDKSEKVRKLKMWSKRDKEYDKALIRFTYPGDIEGTSLLSLIERKSDNENQWMYLPAYRKLRRVGGTERGDRFVNTELYYQDLRSIRVDDYAYQMLGKEKCGKAECYKIESKATNETLKKEWPYSKVIIWVRTDNYFRIKYRFFDKKDAELKEFRYKKISKVSDTAWRAELMLINNLQTKRSTKLKTIKREVNKTISDDVFSPRSLEP
jgi:hypothetical protein